MDYDNIKEIEKIENRLSQLYQMQHDLVCLKQHSSRIIEIGPDDRISGNDFNILCPEKLMRRIITRIERGIAAEAKELKEKIKTL